MHLRLGPTPNLSSWLRERFSVSTRLSVVSTAGRSTMSRSRSSRWPASRVSASSPRGVLMSMTGRRSWGVASGISATIADLLGHTHVAGRALRRRELERRLPKRRLVAVSVRLRVGA